MYRLEEKQIRLNVFMENELRIVLNRESQKLTKILKPYVGKKAFKADGSFIKKIDDQFNFDRDADVPPLVDGHRARIHFIYPSTGYKSIYLKVGLNWNGGISDDGDYYCEYRDNGYWIADNDNGVLSELKTLSIPLVDENTEVLAYNTAYDAKEASAAASRNLLPIHDKAI